MWNVQLSSCVTGCLEILMKIKSVKNKFQSSDYFSFLGAGMI
jgi:hypothetical protein